MGEGYFFAAAAFVSTLLCVGLALTIREFRYGQPRREARYVEKHGDPTRRDR